MSNILLIISDHRIFMDNMLLLTKKDIKMKTKRSLLFSDLPFFFKRAHKYFLLSIFLIHYKFDLLIV